MNRATQRTELLRLGFVDLDRALADLDELPGSVDLLAYLGRTADPDAALRGLCRLAEVAEDRAALLTAVRDDEGTAMRLLSVLGASAALADHLVNHPAHWRELTDPGLGSTRPAAWAVRDALRAAVAGKPDAEAVDALRVEYRRLLLRLAARDLTHHLGVDDAAAELSDLAAGTLEAALAAAPVPLRLCHNDLLNANLIDDGTRIRIVDWEYAAMGDPWFDLGNLAVNHDLDADAEVALLAAWRGRPPRPSEVARLRLMRVASDLREGMWGVLQSAVSDLGMDFRAYAAEHLERALAAAATPGYRAALAALADASGPADDGLPG